MLEILEFGLQVNHLSLGQVCPQLCNNGWFPFLNGISGRGNVMPGWLGRGSLWSEFIGPYWFILCACPSIILWDLWMWEVLIRVVSLFERLQEFTRRCWGSLVMRAQVPHLSLRQRENVVSFLKLQKYSTFYTVFLICWLNFMSRLSPWIECQPSCHNRFFFTLLFSLTYYFYWRLQSDLLLLLHLVQILLIVCGGRLDLLRVHEGNGIRVDSVPNWLVWSLVKLIVSQLLDLGCCFLDSSSSVWTNARVADRGALQINSVTLISALHGLNRILLCCQVTPGSSLAQTLVCLNEQTLLSLDLMKTLLRFNWSQIPNCSARFLKTLLVLLKHIYIWLELHRTRIDYVG